MHGTKKLTKGLTPTSSSVFSTDAAVAVTSMANLGNTVRIVRA